MFSTFLSNKILDAYFGSVAIGAPATLYVAAHLATTLSAGAASAQNQISVVFAVPVGTSITIDPLGTPETFTVSARSGAGPYLLTLSGNLANARLAGVYVRFSPNAATGAAANEPAGNAYARVAVTNNLTNFPAAVAGSKSNGTIFTFAQATPAGWGLVTDLMFYDALTVGNFIAAGQLTTAQLIQALGVLSVPIGLLTLTEQ